MHLYLGTSGYSYKEWKGTFYPQDLPDRRMLPFYAEHFSAVEINNSFYRMPKVAVLEAWAAQVPARFKFVLKAPRRITHLQRLQDAGDSVHYLLEVARVLKERLGPLLFQLPPDFKKDLPLLDAFLALLPLQIAAAFEFRHQSWLIDEVFDLLQNHRVALCISDGEGRLQVPFVATANWGYLRLRRSDYGDKELQELVVRLLEKHWQESYVFFKHEATGKGPQLAKRFLELASGEGFCG